MAGKIFNFYSKSDEPEIKIGWLPALVGILFSALVIFLWYTLDRQERTAVQNKIKIETDYNAEMINVDLHNRISAVKQIAQTWVFKREMSEDEFLDRARSYMLDVSGFQLLGWVDQDGFIRWSILSKEEKNAINSNLIDYKNLQTEMKKARKFRTPVVTSIIDLFNGEKGFSILVPIFIGEKFNGYIIAVINIQQWLDFVFSFKNNKLMNNESRISVFYDNEQVYKQAQWDELDNNKMGINTAISVMDHKITITVQLTDSLVNNSKIMVLKIGAALGILLSILLSIAVRLYQKSISQTLKNNAVKQKMELEIIEHKRIDEQLQQALLRIDIATKAGNIGIWNEDLLTGKKVWSDRMFEFYDLPSGVVPSYEKWLNMIHQDDRQNVDSMFKNALEGKAKFDTEYRVVLANGNIRNIRVASRLEYDHDGKPQHMIGLNWDITEHRQIEESLKHQSDMQKIIMEISSQNINVPSGEAADAIKRALKIMGKFVSADRVYVAEFDFVNNSASVTFEWCNEYIVSKIDILQNVPIDGLLDWVVSHFEGDVAFLYDMSIVPESKWKKLFELQGIKSLEAVLMVYRKDIVGFVGFESAKIKKVYTDSELDLLKLFSRTLVNIRTRINSESALQESEDKIRQLLNSTGEAIMGIDIDDKCIFANPSAARMLGYANAQFFLGKQMHELIHYSYPDGRKMEMKDCKICQALINGSSLHVDNEVFWKMDGTGLNVEYWSYPQIVNGKITGAVVTFFDITERKKVQEQLATERRRLSFILEGTNVGTWEWNVQTGETVFNDRWARIVGYTLDELAPVSIDTWMKLINTEDLEKSNTLLKKHFNKESDYYECEVRMKHKNGNWVWILDRGKVATWTDDGRPLIMSGTHQDITASKQADEEREKLILKLEKALLDVNKLSGMLPICSSCKRIRDDKGYWNQIESYIKEHSEAEFTHGLCPECVTKLYPEFVKENMKEQI